MRFKRRPQANRCNAQMRVLWITNFAAPYRLPVWDQLRTSHILTIGLLESRKSLAADPGANRGTDWHVQEASTPAFVEIPTWKVKVGEARYYVLKSFLPLLAVGGQDVVVFGGWESPAYWLLLFAAMVLGVARVGFYESTLTTMRHRTGPIAWIRSWFFRQMHAVVVPGQAAREALQHIGVPRSKILEGFNAIDVEAFRQKCPTDVTSEDPSGGHRYLYVGQLIPRKRVDAIIDAFSRIAGTADELTIVGSGQLNDELTSLAKSRGTSIRFLPYIDNRLLPQLMAKHHTLVLASADEVWGMVVNEALAAGLHVVVSDNCGVVPSVAEMQGVFIASRNLRDLAARLRESRDSWGGKISTPEILRWTPERFADVFSDAMRRAVLAISR
ncbi:glycosyltransferase family 4 protein [Arthrobacter sp. FW306-04-A]|uniref:glycosyltransferase family 4 protein n=1 Tax=Arthrobacter sp. FW306-04-A TaxID=2879619 RepID=UPI0037C13B28|nr:glycosyltransferase family 4 protein [Arthrobacter sp. FW306-04-A]